MQRRMVPGTPNLLRLVNRNTILFYLEQMVVTSRAQLSTLSGLSPPTVSTVIRELLDEGWACEVGDGISRGGKPPQLIKLNPNGRWIGAAQMNSDRIRVRLTNLAGEVLAQAQFQPPNKDAPIVADLVAKQMRQLMEMNGLTDHQVLGLGVAVPGVVDDKGVVSNAPEFGWDREPIQDLIAEKVSIPVVVDNDVKLAALGDGWRRKFTSGTMVYVHLGHGIGAGILIDGRVYKGANFAAGEISNLIVDPSTVQSASGGDGLNQQLGRFERRFGLDALLSDTVQPSLNEDKAKWIMRHLAYGLTNLISLLDPHTIVFGGEMTALVDDFVGNMKRELERYSSFVPELFITPLGDEASLFGATRAVMDDYKSQVTWTTV